MPSPKQLWEARKQVLLSYSHKAILVAIACFAFSGLRWLGDQKTWDAGNEVRKVVSAAVTSALSGSGVSGLPSGSGQGLVTCPEISDLPRSFGSREQMIAAMQDRAESCVWENLQGAIDAASKQLATIGKKEMEEMLAEPPPKSGPRVSRFTRAADQLSRVADFIAKEEALAATTAKAARQNVYARLTSMRVPLADPAAANASGWQKVTAWLAQKAHEAGAEDSGTHVVFEMLWFASLLLGVVASSILFVIVLTALPITGGEGFWTERIRKLLEDIPAASKSFIAVPLAAVAIGGGTLAGTVATTEAGGRARHVYDRTFSAAPAKPGEPVRTNGSGVPPPAIDQRTFRTGDINTFNGVLPPYLDKLGPIADSLSLISDRSESLVVAVGQTGKNIGLAFQSVASDVRGLTRTASETSSLMADLQQNIRGLRTDLDRDAQTIVPLVKAIEKLEATVDRRDNEMVRAIQAVEKIEAIQAGGTSRVLAQQAETDARKLLDRTFGPRLYHVGPLVPSLMAARLEESTESPEAKAMIDALVTMRKAGSLSRAQFEEQLRTALEQKGLSERAAKKLLQENLPALLKVCALPRL